MPDKPLFRQNRNLVWSQVFNIDNGAGTTVDEILLDAGGRPVRVLRAYALYQETAGTVAAGTFAVGVAAGGATLVAATAYVNSATVGDVTEGTILINGYVAPNDEIWVRHTGVAATAAGTAKICIEYVFDE